MANSFSGIEMLKIAILMENEGYMFYKNGAENTTGELKEFLLSCADQELSHKERFEEMYDELEAKDEVSSEYLYSDEVSAYLSSLIENQVFKKDEDYKDAFVDTKTAVKNAYDTEIRTVDVYTVLYEGITDGEAKKIMSAIIDEEKAHAAFFENLMKHM